ncbi:MAG: DUF1295 domain-containing protein [Nocardioides sp.]|uniref:DUF1295 domain-containing protein n=1 Tax=Nocardioides sp. TaxID=35761 RepID=UPI0039E27CC8
MNALVIVLAGVAAVAVVMTAAAITAKRQGRVAIVDAAWGAAFVLLAVVLVGVSALLREDSDASPRSSWLPWLVAALVVVWGVRLTAHLVVRVLGSDHDDPRYEEMLGGKATEVPFVQIVLKVFALQGVIVLLVAAPLYVVALADVSWSWWVPVGVVVWLVGVLMESAADRQLKAYRADPDRPPLLRTGVWSWSRHPNYFGDACVWWGIWLAGGTASTWWLALITSLGPIAMTWFLTAVSGVRLAERRMAGRPGWDEYAARTSVFVPLPPRRLGP